MDDDFIIMCLEISHVWKQIYFFVSMNSTIRRKHSTMNCPRLFQTMRRREIQSFSLKLSDLKEYEKAREERAELNKSTKSNSGSPNSPIKLVKYGPKSKQEIRDRIGMKS